MEANKKRFIRVAGELIEVSEEVYLTYYRGKRREKAQHEKEQFHHVVSLFGSGRNSHLASSKNRQFWSNRNRQQPRFVYQVFTV